MEKSTKYFLKRFTNIHDAIVACEMLFEESEQGSTKWYSYQEIELELKKEQPKQLTLDWDGLLLYLNEKTSRGFKTINTANRAKYKARLKENYTRNNIVNAINKAVTIKHHIDNGYQHLTPEFFSRADILDKYGMVPTEGKAKTKDESLIDDL